MLHESQTLVHSLDHEQLAADAARVTSLYDAAVVLLSGECGASAVTTARGVLLESRAILANVVDALEGLAARKAEAERAERLHREQAAKSAAGSVR